jgi:RNA polymerase sigma-70 factor, ECF subfamily
LVEDADRELSLRAQKGDRTAMELLYRRHAAVVHAYARRATGSRDLADDVTQETFFRAFRGLDRFDQRSTFRTWLFAICINCTRTKLKRIRTRPQEIEIEKTQLAIEPEPSSGWTKQRLEAALGQLPEGYREAIILHDVLDMDHHEIATARGCTVGTSKSQLHKARAKMRDLLAPLLGGSDVLEP